MRVSVEQRHIDAGIRLNTADPFALAIKEELDKLPLPAPEYPALAPNGYLRVERVVSVTSSVGVMEHRIVKRKGREETDLFYKKYFFGPKKEFNLNDPAFDWLTAYGFGREVKPTVIEITEA